MTTSVEQSAVADEQETKWKDSEEDTDRKRKVADQAKDFMKELKDRVKEIEAATEALVRLCKEAGKKVETRCTSNNNVDFYALQQFAEKQDGLFGDFVAEVFDGLMDRAALEKLTCKETTK